MEDESGGATAGQTSHCLGGEAGQETSATAGSQVTSPANLFSLSLTSLSSDLHTSKPDSPYYNVLLGSAISDLPPPQALHKVTQH